MPRAPRSRRSCLVVLALLSGLAIGRPATAELKIYDASPTRGTPGDQIDSAAGFCPIVRLDFLQGSATIDDPGTGTVTLQNLTIDSPNVIVLGPDQLTGIFGPGSFLFIDGSSTLTNTDVLGTGSSAPGGRVEWGIVSGWGGTRRDICVSSPVTICLSSCFCEPPPGPWPPSATYDLGTWTFDAMGDYETAGYLVRVTNGGLGNTNNLLRGAFVGASLPALPLFGAGVLAAALLISGARRLHSGSD